MAHQVKLEAATRSGTGKGFARELRRTGKVPGVIYGHHRAPEAVTLDATLLSRALTGIAAESTLLDVAIDGRTPVKALLREIQRDALRPGTILHVDLYEVKADEKVRVSVPVHLVGTSDGVRTYGGVVDWVLHALEIECFPQDIPEHVEIDMTPLALGQSVHVSDLSIPKARILNDAALPVVSIVSPKVHEDAPAAEGAATAEPELIRKPKAEESDAKA